MTENMKTYDEEKYKHSHGDSLESMHAECQEEHDYQMLKRRVTCWSLFIHEIACASSQSQLHRLHRLNGDFLDSMPGWDSQTFLEARDRIAVRIHEISFGEACYRNWLSNVPPGC